MPKLTIRSSTIIVSNHNPNHLNDTSKSEQMDERTDRRTDGRTDRHTDRQTHGQKAHRQTNQLIAP